MDSFKNINNMFMLEKDKIKRYFTIKVVNT